MDWNDPIWLTEADVGGLISLPETIECVERVVALEARGGAQTMAKTFAAWEGGGTLHALGGVIEDTGIAGTKTWLHAGGAEPLLPLWDSTNGRLRAVIEAFVLGQLRTASISAVATRWLARPDADRMAIIGTGKQAFAQVAAVAAVRQLRQVRVYSPTPSHRAAFVGRLSRELDCETVEAASVEDAVAGAHVITTATRARSPFLFHSMLAAGAHVNAIGAITPERCELAPDVIQRADRIVADHAGDARRLSGELAACEAIVPLSTVVADRQPRPANETLTVFKALGLGLADVAIAAEVLRRAAAQGAGRPFAGPTRVTPQWRKR